MIHPELALGEEFRERLLADWERMARNPPIVLHGSLTVIPRWHVQEIGLGVQRCPKDPENRWPL